MLSEMIPLLIRLHTDISIRYFGGSLDFFSLEGWGKACFSFVLVCSLTGLLNVGSDVYLKLRCLDEAGDSTI